MQALLTHLVWHAGCGKTAMVEELARTTGNIDMVRLHLDDQMDSKSLLGAYVCTSNPEQFVWQPGPLTQVNFCPTAVSNSHQAPSGASLAPFAGL